MNRRPVAARRPVRRLGLLAAVMVMALVTTACGSTADADADADADDLGAADPVDDVDAPEPSDGAAEEPLLPAAEGVTAYPLTIESDAGEAVIEERPNRIAIVDIRPTSTDILLEMGATPILASENFSYGGWTPQRDIDRIETIWEYGEDGLISRELLLDADPDLIVHYSNRDLDQEHAADLNRVAPTISFLEQEVPWQDMVALLAEVLDLTGEGERVMDEVDAVLADARETLAEHHGKTATISHIHADGRIVYGSRPGRDAGTLLEELGFVLSESGEEVPEDFVISMENIGLLDADFLYVSAFAEVDAAPVVESALFQQLPVVADGRTAYEFEDVSDNEIAVAWGLLVPGPRSIKAVVPLLAESANEVLD